MAIDAVSQKAFHTPMFVAGVLLLVAGLIPVAVGAISGWNRISDVSFLSVFAPLGALLIAFARSQAVQGWRQKR